MNTITLDSKTYNAVVDYAQTNNITISDVVKAGMQLLKERFGKETSTAHCRHYYISSAVKDLETGFKCPENISGDYKKEIVDSLSEKHL
jgi:hypothetical protein